MDSISEEYDVDQGTAGGPGLGEERLDEGGPAPDGRRLAHARASPMKAEVSFSR